MKIRKIKDVPERCVGRPTNYKQSKYYPAIKIALAGGVASIAFSDERDPLDRARTTQCSIRQMLIRNKLWDRINVSYRKGKLYLYPRKTKV